MQKKERMYQVQWGIGILATSHREAAETARAIQLNPDSDAVVFYVTQGHSKTVEIDLTRPT